jgi:glycyl-tRNA synthetase beta chain
VATKKPADFLVELGTEELPPKALRNLRDAFAQGIADGLEQNRLAHGDISSFASPRRLAVLVADLAASQDDREVTKKGPPLNIALDDAGEATRAGLAFAKKCGVDFAELHRHKTDAGEWLSYTAIEGGRDTADLVVDIVQQALDALPIPRRMRWGASAAEFVRPVHWLVLLHGESVIDGCVLGVTASNKSRGHRFHAPGAITITSANKYAALLEKEAFVVADFDARKELVVTGVQAVAQQAGGLAVGDDALFDEVTALTEWPVPLAGTFDSEFLSLPREVIVATLTSHQRYFPLQNENGELLPAFVTVANIESKEPDRVRDGNERVIRPRLADAAFFWEADQQTNLDARRDALEQVVYQRGLGSLRDKSRRVAKIANSFVALAGADAAVVARAAELAKCDLLTGMVGEFPELQGTMGAYYAAASDEPAAVSVAIGEQYLPRFAGDVLPGSPAGQVLAIADKIDTVAGVFALGKKPSGNRDPFGLRRAALGVIRILVENKLDVDITEFILAAVRQQPADGVDEQAVSSDIYEFFVDRLRSYLLDQDNELTVEMFNAVRARQPCSLLDFQERIAAVKIFMRHDAAVSLAAANKRTANILRKSSSEPGATDTTLFAEEAEIALHQALLDARQSVIPLLEERAYSDALQRLAALRQPVDTFFNDVMVMADEPSIRNNRLALLAELRSLFLNIADISRLTPAQD